MSDIDKFEKAFNSWRSGDHSVTVQKVLLESGLDAYSGYLYDVSNVAEYCEKAHKGNVLRKSEEKAIQSLYYELEDMNFHTELVAIMEYTGVPYE